MATSNLITDITSRYSHMTKTEKKVADVILASPQEALNATITDLAHLCGVCEASIFRFCRALELKGYQDFRLSLAISLSNENKDIKRDILVIKESDSSQKIVQNVMNAYITALEQTFQTLNYQSIPKAAGLLLSARSINVFGFGNSGNSAGAFRTKFMKILPNVIYNEDSHAQMMQAALLGERDLAVIFCNSGITKDCIEIARICHQSKTSVIFITKFAKSPAAKYATVFLQCGAIEGPMEGGSIAAKAAQLFLIDVLYAEAYRKLGHEAEVNKRKTSQVITEKMM